MKHIVQKLLALAFLACSSPVDEASDMAEALEAGAPLVEDEDLAQLEQPVLALNSTTKQWGSQTGASFASCNKTSSGQVCTLAKFKAIEVAYNPSNWTSDEIDQMSLVVLDMNTRYGGAGWLFTFVDSATSPGANKVRLLVSHSNNTGGTNGNDLSNYRTMAFHSPAAMTEGQQAGMSAPVGQYQNHGSCSTTLYRVRIQNKGANSNEDMRLLDHALGNAVVICMGLGTTSGGAYAYRRTAINLTTFAPADTGGDLCRANIGDMTDLADFSVQPASICAD